MTATPTPPPAETPVPYGPPVTDSDSGAASGVTLDLSSRSIGGTAGKWAIRLLLPLIIRAIFRAIFR
jgi:hypothetical protein